MKWIHLRRRETTLHRAVRLGKVEIVRRLIEKGADCHMANTRWQTPLHLARLIDQGKNFPAHSNHESFLGRISLGVLHAVPIVDDLDDAPCKQIRSKLEHEAVSTILQPWHYFRAIREVKWSWDDYETDDLGVRFVLFNFALLALAMGLLTLVVHLQSFFPYLLFGLTQPLKLLADTLLEVRDCYVGSLANASDPHTVCTGIPGRWALAPLDLQQLGPALDHQFQLMLNVIAGCYDNATNVTVAKTHGANDSDQDEPLFPGCGEEDFENNIGNRQKI
jgi:hypothetical protein